MCWPEVEEDVKDYKRDEFDINSFLGERNSSYEDNNRKKMALCTDIMSCKRLHIPFPPLYVTLYIMKLPLWQHIFVCDALHLSDLAIIWLIACNRIPVKLTKTKAQ